MYGAAHTYRGPSPWREPGRRREPRTDADRLVLVAWCQLGALLAWSAWLALYAGFMLVLGAGAGAIVVPVAMWTPVIALAVVAVVVVHRHRRGASSLPAALVLLAASPVAALAAEHVAGVPLPFFI